MLNMWVYIYTVYIIYTLYQPNHWKKLVEVSKPGFELVFAKKSFGQQNQVFDEAASPQPGKNSSKPITRKKP